jgi:hypothetical protein
MGVGNKFCSATADGVDEGVGVGTTAPFEELQEININNPNKQLNTSINFFVISCHRFSFDPSQIVKNIIAPITLTR